MNLESFLQYFMGHNQAIINWLFVFVLVLAAVVTLFTILDRGESSVDSAGSKDLEGTLRKVMDEKMKGFTPSAAPAVQAAPVIGSADDLVPAEMARALQLELESKKAEIIKMQGELAAQLAAAAQAPAAAPASVSPDMQAKVAELEAKLAEYSIIEDDIADLCLFKEENVRLKEEITRLQAAGGAPAAPVASGASVASTAEPAPSPVAEAPAAPVAAAPAPAPVETPASPAPTQPSVLAQSDIDAALAEVQDDLEAEFAAAVEAQQQAEAKAGAPTVADSALDAALAAEAELEKAFTGAGTPQEEPEAQPDPLADEIDTEKMMAEMASLSSLSEAEPDVLEGDLDTDKISEEASAMDELVRKGS